MHFPGSHILSIASFERADIERIFAVADRMEPYAQRKRVTRVVEGAILSNMFYEPSTRTRTSFEIAAMRLSADVVNITATASSLQKGETLKDTALNLQALHADIIVLRHSSAGSPRFLADRLDSCIINAGDGSHEHPTQGLLDIFTMRQKHGRIAGLNVLVVGDILFSRVARSNIHGLVKLGANVTLVGPTTLVPSGFEKLGVRVVHRLDDVLEEAEGIFSRSRRIHFPFRAHQGPRGAPQARMPDHAPRPDQPRS